MPETQEPAPGQEENRFPRGMKVRLFAYLIAGHFIAAFIYLLFELGARSN